MRVEKTNWGGLANVVVSAVPAGAAPKLALVLCHGYGAPANDLVGLAEHLLRYRRIAEQSLLIFPAAPIDLAPQGLVGGRAWWPIDLDRLINRATPEVLRQFRTECPEQLPEARARLLALLEELKAEQGLLPSQVVLGGFSQGSMLATDVALRLADGPAALCIFSGALINEREWSARRFSRQGLKVLQSHGLYDSILPLSQATALRDALQAAGGDVEFISFPGDHEIPPIALAKLVRLLGDLLPPEQPPSA